jgi:hypothetical protein
MAKPDENKQGESGMADNVFDHQRDVQESRLAPMAPIGNVQQMR